MSVSSTGVCYRLTTVYIITEQFYKITEVRNVIQFSLTQGILIRATILDFIEGFFISAKLDESPKGPITIRVLINGQSVRTY